LKMMAGSDCAADTEGLEQRQAMRAGEGLFLQSLAVFFRFQHDVSDIHHCSAGAEFRAQHVKSRRAVAMTRPRRPAVSFSSDRHGQVSSLLSLEMNPGIVSAMFAEGFDQ
jgi:hypothetical protein